MSIHEHGGASALLAGFLVLLFVLSFSVLSLLHGWLYMRFVRPAPLGMVLGFPIAWCFREWSLTWMLTGFPWLLAGYTPMDTWLGGYAPIVGVLGLGIIVAGEASLIAWCVNNPRPRNISACVGILAALWSGGWGATKIDFVKPSGKTIAVSAVQGDIDRM